MKFLSSSAENGMSNSVNIPSAITAFKTAATCSASPTFAFRTRASIAIQTPPFTYTSFLGPSQHGPIVPCRAALFLEPARFKVAHYPREWGNWSTPGLRAAGRHGGFRALCRGAGLRDRALHAPRGGVGIHADHSPRQHPALEDFHRQRV